MANNTFQNVKISGICVALPQRRYITKEVAPEMDEKAIKRFERATGVKERYLSVEGQTTSDLCFVATKELIAEKNIDEDEIDALIFISQNEDYKRPSTAIVLQNRLGLSKNCLAFDINLGCSGFVYGVYVLAGLIESKAIKNALLLAGDVNKDLGGDPLFGDAGSATYLTYEPGSLISGLMKSDGSGFKFIYTPGGGQRTPINKDNQRWDLYNPRMDGAAVFEFSISQVPDLICEFLKMNHTDINTDYDYVFLHQANKMIIKHISDKIGVKPDRVPISIDKYGNVSSASIPLAIADFKNQINQEKQSKLLMSGFGVGLSLGVISAEINWDDVLPIIYSDYVWDVDI